MQNYPDVTQMREFVAFDGTFAAVAGRMINFETGSSTLKPGHRQWLEKEVFRAIMARPNAWVDIYGYASKKGNTQQNLALSKARATEAKNFLGGLLAMKGKSIETMVKIDHGFGEDAPDYIAGESDNSPNWRAAEVIVFGTKPRIVRKPKTQIQHNKFEIRLMGGFSIGAIVAQSDNYFFQIVDVVRRRTMFFHYTGGGIAVPLPPPFSVLPSPGSVSQTGPAATFTTRKPVELYQFNARAGLMQEPGATFGGKSIAGTLLLTPEVIGSDGLRVFTNPSPIRIEGGPGFQMPGAGSSTIGTLAKISEEMQFVNYY